MASNPASASRRAALGRGVRESAAALASFAVVGLAWQAVVALGWLDLPGPVAVARTFLSLLVTPDPVFGKTIWEMVGLSLWIVLRGGLVGVLAGLPTGLVLGAFPRIRPALRPLLGVLQPIPPLAWLPLAYLVFAGAARPSVWVQLFVVALAVFFPVTWATFQGVEYSPPVFAMVARTFGATSRQLLFRVSLPAALPALMSGIRVGVGVGWMSIIAAEFVGGRTGIGFFVWNAYSLGGRSAQVMAGILAIGLTGLAMNYLLLLLEKKVTPWH